MPNAVANTPPSMVHGYDVTMLIDICKVILAANAVPGVLELLAGQWLSPRVCPHCGHPPDDFVDEDTIAG